MNLKGKILLFIGIIMLPMLLSEFIKTESCTNYLWWENIIGFSIMIMFFIVWFEFWFNKFFKDYK